MTADDAFAQALAPGTEVHGYRIQSVIGAGGFGVTYLAEHVAMNHQVALKEFLPGGIAARAKTGDTVRAMSPAHQEDFAWGLARFREEARTLARLKHPSIVPVHNYFEANGTAYCVMEYVAGTTLDARLGPRGTLPADVLARLVPPLLDGIAAVHAAGFLHRDIKPANILVNERGAPVLIDFGAARQALGAHSRSLTAVLSEGYAPYEQYQRDGDQGPWTDIYALGGTLYRCVAGERPPEATKRIEARIKNKRDPLTPAAEAGAGRYPAPLLAAIDRSLSVMEAERPQSIAELRALIEAPVPSVAAPPAALETAAPTRSSEATLHPDASAAASRRRRLWPAVTAIVVLVAGGSVAAYVVSQRGAEERHQASLAEMARKAAEDAKRKAEEDARRRAEEDARRKAEEEAAKRADQERLRREAQIPNECDHAAAPPDRKFALPGVTGVESHKISPERATRECRAAVRRYPDEIRFKAYLARALSASREYAEAYAVARPLAEAGHAIGQAVLAGLLIDGRGATQNVAEGLVWLRKAADQGYLPSMENIGGRYWDGKVVAKDEAEACRWFRRAAERDHARSQASLGRCYLLGQGVSKDAAEGVRWVRKAADQGDAAGQYLLGVTYRWGNADVLKDAQQALVWFRRAADQGFTPAQHMVGLTYDEGGAHVEAFSWFEKAANSGHAEAQYRLGYAHEHGRGAKKEMTWALYWYRKSAAQGYEAAKGALLRLGVRE